MLAFAPGSGLGAAVRSLPPSPPRSPRPSILSTSTAPSLSRRTLLTTFLFTTATANLFPPSALASWWPPPSMKKAFASGMATGMGDYELAVSARKRALFSTLPAGARILDVGIGAGPNLAYLPRHSVVTGLDPNQFMFPFANKKAAELVTRGIQLDVVQGAAEDIPFDAAVFDAVICTLTLCSVRDVAQAVREMERVLKKGGVLIFVEHVHAEKGGLRLAQSLLTPLQVALADGCHLNRDSGEMVRKFGVGLEVVEAERFQIDLGFEGKLISTQVSGKAIKK